MDFISYSRKDTEFVRRLTDALAQRGHNVWVDWEDIPATADWWKEIRAGIEGADSFIFIISPDSVRSEVCTNEISHAVANNKRFVPVLYRDLLNQGEGSALHPAISSHNWIFFREQDSFDSAVEKLVTALETDLKHVGEHTRLLLRALEWDEKGRDSSLLLNGTEIERAEAWLAEGVTKKPEPTDLHTQYILASRSAAAQRQRGLLIGVTLALIVAITLALISLFFFFRSEDLRVQSDNNAATAVSAQGIAEVRGSQARSLALAANARNLIAEYNPNFALALAFAAHDANKPPLADIQQTVAQAIYEPAARYRLRGHAKSVLDVDLDREGLRGLSISLDGALILWDIRGSAQIGRFTFGEQVANTAAFSPDGSAVLLGMLDGTLVLWDIEGGAVQRRFEGHSGPVTTTAFVYPGQRIVSGAVDRTLRVWDIETGEELKRIESPGVILDLAVSVNGERAVTGSADETMSGSSDDLLDRTVRVWNLDTGDELYKFDPASGFVRSVAFSPDGRSVASGTWNAAEGGKIQVWDLRTGERGPAFYGHTDIITSLVFTADSAALVSSSWDRSIRVWDIATGIEKRRFQGHSDRVLDLAVTQDNQFILTGTGNVGDFIADPNADRAVEPDVWLWDLENRAVERVFRGHQDWVWTAALSPDGKFAASGSGTLNPPSDDTSVRLWNVESGEEIWAQEDHSATVNGVAFSPDGQTIASASWDSTVRLWDVDTGESHIGYAGHTDRVLSVAFSPDGQTAISSSRDKTIHLWDTASGQEIRRFVGHEGAVNSAAFSADGRYIVSGSDDRRVFIWDVESGAKIREFTGHSDRVNNAVFNADATQVLSTSWDTSARLWDVESGNLIYHFVGHSRAVFGAAFSPDGRSALTSSADLTLRLWDVSSGQEIRRLTGHTNWVLSVVFSQDGRFALSAAEDDTVRLWRVENSLDDLIEWGRSVRYVPVLTCAEREAYNVEPFCDANGVVPTITPRPAETS